MIGELIILLILAMAIPVTFSFSASSLAELLGSLFAIKTTKNKTYIIQLLLLLFHPWDTDCCYCSNSTMPLRF